MFWSFIKPPVVLAIILYLLIFFIRSQQGGWEIDFDLFPKIREGLDQRISKLLPSPQAELLSGILLGNKKDLPVGLRLALRDTSTLHIVVVSGQNLTLMAGLFLNIAGLIKRKTAIILSISAVIFYTILTGAQIPVVRAAIMAILGFSAEIYGRQKSGLWVLCMTAAFMLLLNPAWITDLSFQLSFLSTFGVIAIAPSLEDFLKFFPTFIKQDIAISTGAQLMILPVIVQNFHQLSLVSIFANLLVGWTVPFIMIFGGLAIFLGPFVAVLANIFLTYFIYIVQFFSSLPFAWAFVGEKVWIVWVGYYMLLAGVMLLLTNAKKANFGRSEKGN